MNAFPGLNLAITSDYLKAAVLVSLLSVWVLVGLFYYLNRYTRRRYFNIWTAGWLFYALWLTLGLFADTRLNPPLILMFKQWCLSSTAVFLVWGSARFLGHRTPQKLFGLFTAFLFTWSYIGAYHLEDNLQSQLPIFSLIGLASLMTGVCFGRFRHQRDYIGAGLLSFGFSLWGLYLAAYPFLQSSEYMASAGFFATAVLQLFIAVSMIVLMLEEARTINRAAWTKFQTAQDEKYALETRISSTEERFRSVFDQASEAIIVADGEDLTILEINRTAERLLGVERTQFAHEKLSAFCRFVVPPETVLKTGEEWFNFIAEQRELDLLHRDGQITACEVSCSRITLEGRPACQFFFRELTERAKLEKQLRQAERLSSLGRMVSGVAHELNNPLAVVKGYLELVLARKQLSAQDREDLEKVAHESNRAAKLVRNFLSLSREEAPAHAPVDLNAVVNRAVENCKVQTNASGVKITLGLDHLLPKVNASFDQVQQVIANLITNSLQAMQDQTNERVINITSQRKGELIRLIVEDNGLGVPESLVGRIFEPFFTTKQVGVGTGLGLSIAHSIMKEHHGRIFYRHSNLGGAAFALEFPLVDIEADTYKTPDTDLIVKKHKEIEAVGPARILVLDDERALSEMLSDILSLLGHSATICNSSPEAVDLIEHENFDLILSDFRMPFMDGKAFYQAVLKKNPDQARRIVFLSGDLVNEDTRKFLQSISNPHLSKPFDVAAIEEMVTNCLRQPAQCVAA